MATKTLKVYLAQTVRARALWPWYENWPYVLGSWFHREIKKEIFKHLLVPNCKGQSFHIWHVASSSGHLPKYFKLWLTALSVRPSFRPSNCKGQSFHIWHVASSSGHLPKYFKSNYGSGFEVGPMFWVLRLYIKIKKEIFKNLLVPNLKGGPSDFGTKIFTKILINHPYTPKAL